VEDVEEEVEEQEQEQEQEQESEDAEVEGQGSEAVQDEDRGEAESAVQTSTGEVEGNGQGKGKAGSMEDRLARMKELRSRMVRDIPNSVPLIPHTCMILSHALPHLSPIKTRSAEFRTNPPRITVAT